MVRTLAALIGTASFLAPLSAPAVGQPGAALAPGSEARPHATPRSPPSLRIPR